MVPAAETSDGGVAVGGHVERFLRPLDALLAGARQKPLLLRFGGPNSRFRFRLMLRFGGPNSRFRFQSRDFRFFSFAVEIC